MVDTMEQRMISILEGKLAEKELQLMDKDCLVKDLASRLEAVECIHQTVCDLKQHICTIKSMNDVLLADRQYWFEQFSLLNSKVDYLQKVNCEMAKIVNVQAEEPEMAALANLPQAFLPVEEPPIDQPEIVSEPTPSVTGFVMNQAPVTIQ